MGPWQWHRHSRVNIKLNTAECMTAEIRNQDPISEAPHSTVMLTSNTASAYSRQESGSCRTEVSDLTFSSRSTIKCPILQTVSKQTTHLPWGIRLRKVPTLTLGLALAGLHLWRCRDLLQARGYLQIPTVKSAELSSSLQSADISGETLISRQTWSTGRLASKEPKLVRNVFRERSI